MSDEEEVVTETPVVDPYETAEEPATEEDPASLLVVDDPEDPGTITSEPGAFAPEPVEEPDEDESVEPPPAEWSELDPDALDDAMAGEDETGLEDELDAASDYDEMELTAEDDPEEPAPVVWDSYEVQARDTSVELADFFQVAVTDDPSMHVAITTLEPGKTYDLRVRGLKSDGATSGWSDVQTVTLPTDQIPPPQPSAPVVVGVPGGVVVSHDGKTLTGGEQPADYAETILWGQRQDQPPMIVDRFTGPFHITYNSLELAPMLWWAQTVDRAGNTSIKSAEVTGQAQPLVDEAGLRDKLQRLSTGEDLVAESVAGYVGQFINVEAAQLNATEIWSNAAWLGAAKFESTGAGKHVLIDADGVVAGNSLTGRRVVVDENGITSYDSAGRVEASFGDPAHGSKLALRSPDGHLQEIGPHIYGSQYLAAYINTATTVDPGSSTNFGSFTAGVSSSPFQVVSHRYKIEAGFVWYGHAESAGSPADVIFQVIPMSAENVQLSGSFMNRTCNLRGYMLTSGLPFYITQFTDLPASVNLGDTIRFRWRIRARAFEPRGSTRVGDVTIAVTPV